MARYCFSKTKEPLAGMGLQHAREAKKRLQLGILNSAPIRVQHMSTLVTIA